MSERILTETVPLIVGGDMLATIQHYSVVDELGLLYHGGKVAVQQIEAAIPYWTKDGVHYADADVPVVCALDDPLMPTFYALAPKGFRKCSATEEGGIRLSLQRGAEREFYSAEACVAVMLGDDFTIFHSGPPAGWPKESPPSLRFPEMRSTLDQIPLFNVRVTIDDFWRLLEDNPKVSLELF